MIDPPIEDRIKSQTQKEACDTWHLIQAKDKDKDNHVHYGCMWAVRKDGIYHICSEKNTEWKI